MIYWMAASLRWPNNTLHCLLAPVCSVNRHRSETTVPTNTPLDIELIDGETQQPEARLATSFTTNKLTVHVCGWLEHSTGPMLPRLPTDTSTRQGLQAASLLLLSRASDTINGAQQQTARHENDDSLDETSSLTILRHQSCPDFFCPSR